jgi:hypothetical protein
MPQLKVNTEIPSLDEDVEIALGISKDCETYELSPKEFKLLKQLYSLDNQGASDEET